MTLQLLLIAATVSVVPTIAKLLRAMIRLIVRLVATAFVGGIVLIVLVDIASHGKLI
jgi:hypothetical protein